MIIDNEREIFGEYINRMGKDRGIITDKSFELCNVNATYPRQIGGSGRIPSLPAFISICNFLRVPASYLLQDELDVSETSDIEELETPWGTAEPS